MNFAQALQIKGQKDDRGYDRKVTMLARFAVNMEFGETQGGKPKCSVKLTDKDNVTHKVYLYGTLPTVAMCTQKAEFNISAFDGQGQQGAYVGYSGFWNSTATIIQDGQQPAQQSQQPATQARQPANAGPADKPVDWDGKELREHRGYALHDACNVLIALATVSQNGQSISKDLALELAETFLSYRYNGLPKTRPTQPSGPNPNYVGDNLPPPDGDIPF